MRKWRSSRNSISVDIELDELYSEMSNQSCKEMAEWLYDDGYLDEYLERERAKNLTSITNGWDWKGICHKLSNSQLRLTNEEEEIIKKIADRL
jgi:hypothetical protein